MKLSKILLSSSLVLSSLFAGAQNKEVTEYVFNPHWYVQGQFGVQETLGETSFGKLISPNAQLALGYQFNPYIGARLAVNSWQSKGAFEFNDVKNVYKWKYVAPTLNITADLTNIFGGYNPERVVAVGVFAGAGANVAFKNDEAATVKQNLAGQGVDALRLYWDGTKTRFVGQFGANIDFKVSKRVSLGLELQANVLPDAYNSKKAGNADWYFNALAGIKVTLGKTHSKKVIPAVVPATRTVHDTVYVDRVVEKVVERPVTNALDREEILRENIFFTLAKTRISEAELKKVDAIAKFLDKHPEAIVRIVGYADKGTGSLKLNLRLAEKRAKAVADELINHYGVDAKRIYTDSMDEKVFQPFPDPVQNRVAVCVVK